MAQSRTEPPYNAAQDANDFPSLTAVSGTAGTADVNGTAEQIRVGANPDTGALFVQDLSGGGGTTNIQGSVQITGGTFNAGTVTLTDVGSNVNVVTGTQQTLGTVGTNLGVGTLTGVGVVSNVTNGSINVLTGTTTLVTTVTTVSNLTNGSVRMTVGTLTTGSLTNVAGLHTGTITTGSLTDVAKVYTGTITTITAGTQNTLGTVGVVNNLVTGTLAALASGTITAGTVDTELPAAAALSDTTANPTTPMIGAALMSYNGATWERAHNEYSTADDIAVQSGLFVIGLNRAYNDDTDGWDRLRTDKSFNLKVAPGDHGTSIHVLGTAGASFWGTIVAACGAGTKQFVGGLDIVVTSGTVEVAVTNIGVGGSTGAGVLARGAFPAGGGLSKQFFPSVPSGTNGTIAYWLGGAGTANITVLYWQGV